MPQRWSNRHYPTNGGTIAVADPLTPFEALSRELNKLRERRVAQRRLIERDTPDRRRSGDVDPNAEPDPHSLDSSNQTP